MNKLYLGRTVSDFGINPLSGGMVTLEGSMPSHPDPYSSYRKPMLDHYHDIFIANILRNIRNGEFDYVFKDSQIEELRQYEPGIGFTYHDGVYTVYLR